MSTCGHTWAGLSICWAQCLCSTYQKLLESKGHYSFIILDKMVCMGSRGAALNYPRTELHQAVVQAGVTLHGTSRQSDEHRWRCDNTPTKITNTSWLINIMVIYSYIDTDVCAQTSTRGDLYWRRGGRFDLVKRASTSRWDGKSDGLAFCVVRLIIDLRPNRADYHVMQRPFKSCIFKQFPPCFWYQDSFRFPQKFPCMDWLTSHLFSPHLSF